VLASPARAFGVLSLGVLLLLFYLSRIWGGALAPPFSSISFWTLSFFWFSCSSSLCFCSFSFSSICSRHVKEFLDEPAFALEGEEGLRGEEERGEEERGEEERGEEEMVGEDLGTLRGESVALETWA